VPVIELDIGFPARETREVSSGELPDVYLGLKGEDSPTFTWNNLGDRVLIVTVDDESSTVSMLNDDTWYYLEISEDEDEIEVMVEGAMTPVPRGVVLPRNLGLEVLQKADDFVRVLSEYSWRLQ
jgi:hypothetical protein